MKWGRVQEILHSKISMAIDTLNYQWISIYTFEFYKMIKDMKVLRWPFNLGDYEC